MKDNESKKRIPHPECKADEVFLGNSSKEEGLVGPENHEGLSGFDRIGWKTKRMGKIAYDTNGNPLDKKFYKLSPVFVKQEEIKNEDPSILASLLS